ncbi:MAG: tol-pal system protein YbgF [Steroidobacteraceae bacterium]
MSAMRIAIVGSCLAGALAALAGCATTPEQDPVLQGHLANLDARTSRIERVISNQSLLNMAQNITSLQQQVRVLQGRIDELDNENDALRKQERALYSDLNRRLQQLSAGSGGTAAAPAPSGPPPGSEQAEYMQALDAIKSGKYSQAAASLQQFLKTYPKSSLADNAQYWLGETYYAAGSFDKAAGAFQGLLSEWPSSSRAPDALLQLGYSQYELKQYGKARATLAEVGKKYPNTNAARQADDRLRQMSANGTSPAASGAPPAGSGASDSH